ncbi:MAG: hypothetical protein PVH99_16010, partial [Desulfobacteraceae bacterium]
DLDEWKDLPSETAKVLEQGLPRLEEIKPLTRKRDEALVRIIKEALLSFRNEGQGKSDDESP